MCEKSIVATAFYKPYGIPADVEIKDIYPDDAEYIIQNNIPVSMESDHIAGKGVIMYFQYGAAKDGTPYEHIEFTNGRSCEDTIHAAVAKLKTFIKS